jgi:hypothetical protein
LDLNIKNEKNMTYTCQPFYSMQKILASGNCRDFHRKFGELTKEKRGVYIWGFAEKMLDITPNACSDFPKKWSPMNEYAVHVESNKIGIYYIGKAVSINIFERIMQERANLFGGFSSIFNWDQYFKDTPMLHMHSQLGDKIAREEKPKRNERLKKHMTNLDRYEKCSHNRIFKIADSPLLYSNACFNQNNIFDLISPGGHFSQKLVDTIKNMSEKFIFTWIEIDIPNSEEKIPITEDRKINIKKLESELINCLGVNVFGIDSKYALNFQELESLVELNKVDWTANRELEVRIKSINKESRELKNSPCGCFK